MNKKNRTKLYLEYKLPTILAFVTSLSFASTTSLDTITVETRENTANRLSVSSDDITRRLVQNERDLVRNLTGITVKEGGRAGNNGFSIRGLDGDRVAINVDGVSAAESFKPRYYDILGFYNGNRNGTELENIAEVDITKGADSIHSGSGGIGGTVTMRTKNPQDFILDNKSWGFYSKTAYDSKNEEKRQVLGFGLVKNGIEAMFQYTSRHGSETKNHGGDSGPDVYRRERGIPDPVTFHSDAFLAKLGYQLNDRHFINAFYDANKPHKFTEEKSFYLANHRFSEDTSQYRRYGIVYEYTPSSTWFEKLKLQYTNQWIHQKAHGYQYTTHDPSVIDKQDFHDIYQSRNQIDFSVISNSINLSDDLSYQVNLFLGGGHSKFNSENYEQRYKAKDKSFNLVVPIKSKNYYVSLQNSINLGDKWLAELGMRYDNYKYSRASSAQFDNADTTLTSLANKSFTAFTGQTGISYFLSKNSLLSYRFNTAFRIPKIEEMFFEIKAGRLFLPNAQLKPEKAQNHELTFTTEGKLGMFSISLFHTLYKDFIYLNEDIKAIKEEGLLGPYFRWGLVYQPQNVDRAKLTGAEINSRLNGSAFGLSDNLYSTFKLSYVKGKKDNGTALMAIQPLTAVLGIGYKSFDDKWNILLTGRYVAAKKAKDTLERTSLYGKVKEFNRKTGELEVTGIGNYPHRFLSGSYFVVDLTSQVKINKYIDLNLGVFNLFNRRYFTWDNLREIKNDGAQGDVMNDGRGLQRYSSPGRNFSASLEIRF
ncbi:TonB-dependent hemoglobin/transferrin/lactoferrin family receptor [[Haemophilus] felis]|nr:TonB-dependent hemoglobin/transferrin/lactoferrin family receptor [[Haemophilus] felis]